MTLWLVLTLMTLVATYLVAEPFLRKVGGSRSAFAGELAVFRDQLKELDRDAADGLIDAGEAETARAEIKRRILRADCANEATAAPLSPDEPRCASAAAVASIVVLASFSVYAVTGSPRLSALGEVRASPTDAGLSAVRRVAADLDARQRTTATERTTIDAMITDVIDRLKRRPNDPEGWRTLGWCYFKTGRFAEAASAYAEAVELRPDAASLRTAWGEALVKAAGGRVTDKAGMIFDDALKLDGGNLRARYFRGLAKEQAGDKAAALNDWIALLNDVPRDEEWASDLKQRIAELAFDINFGAARKIWPPVAAARTDALGLGVEVGESQPARSPPPEGHNQRGNAAIAPGDPVSMIRDLVEDLAASLDRSPHDPEGWIALIRSRILLRETDAAQQALDRAMAIFSDSPQEQRRIAAAAEEVGLTH